MILIRSAYSMRAIGDIVITLENEKGLDIEIRTKKMIKTGRT